MTDEPAPKKPRRHMSSGMPGADYGVFLLSTPLIGGVAILITAFASYSLTGFVWLVVLVALVTAIMALLEIVQAPAAWESGSPSPLLLRWGALVALLWPVGYPLYLRARKQLRLDD